MDSLMAHFDPSEDGSFAFLCNDLNLAIHRALRRVLTHDLADLVLLGIREVVVHFESLETGLPGEKHQQRDLAAISVVFKPWILLNNCYILEPINMVISEGFHQLVAIFGTAESV